jgi:hypothetical protein
VKRRSTSFTSTVVRLPSLIAAVAAGAAGASARALASANSGAATITRHTNRVRAVIMTKPSWPSAVRAGRV